MTNRLLYAVALLCLFACGPGNKLSNYYTFEDKTVFELIERLNKNAQDKQAADMLPAAYEAALEKRKEIITANKNSGHLGDRWMEIAKEREVLLQMYQAIKASPAASQALPNAKDPSPAIASAKEKAATEYYNQGLEYMNYNNRQYAQQAYDYFSKANNAVPGFKDVNNLLRQAEEKSMIRVVVNPVQYDRYGFNYYGFTNDWLQQQMVRDLNTGSFQHVRFFTDWEARAQNIRADRVVDLNFTSIFIGQLSSNNYTIQRSAQIQTGSTKSIPPQPVYTTVYATVYVSRRILQSNATLECRIYDWATGRNILYDNFPDNYIWRQERATYKGDQRALTPADWSMINNRFDDRPPTRNQIADRLIRNCYNLLLNRIQSGVSF
jgi:hypothetical protein